MAEFYQSQTRNHLIYIAFRLHFSLVVVPDGNMSNYRKQMQMPLTCTFKLYHQYCTVSLLNH